MDFLLVFALIGLLAGVAYRLLYPGRRPMCFMGDLKSAIRSWLSTLPQCWRWISNAFFRDLAKTNVVDCRASVFETMVALDRQPAAEIQLASVPRAGLLCQTRHEKRAALRYPCDHVVFCLHECGGKTPIKGRVRNVSACGIGLIVTDRVEPGTNLGIDVYIQTEIAPRTLAARVVNARPMPFGGWFLGCAFAERLADAGVNDLLQSDTRTGLNKPN
jgi:PilZ domain-containing protein